jgi:hypothetical protein
MENSEEFKERALRKIRSKESVDDSRRKRRLSKIFLAIDAIIILLVLLYFYDGSGPEEAYYSTKLDHKKMEFRFSVATVKKSKSYLFTLSIKSNREKKSDIAFDGSIARVEIFQKEDKLLEKRLGNGVNMLSMHPTEIKTFAENIGFTLLDKYIQENSDLLQVRKKSLIQFRKQEIDFRARITLNTSEKITSTVEFKHGVK